MKQSFIHDSVEMGKNVSVGCFSVIEEGVVLGDNVTIGNNVTIKAGTVIGSDVYISDNCVLGRWRETGKVVHRKGGCRLAGAGNRRRNDDWCQHRSLPGQPFQKRGDDRGSGIGP